MGKELSTLSNILPFNERYIAILRVCLPYSIGGGLGDKDPPTKGVRDSSSADRLRFLELHRLGKEGLMRSRVVKKDEVSAMRCHLSSFG